MANQFGGVHGNKAGAATMQWRNKPLFRRTGDVKFKTGAEAAELLVAEVPWSPDERRAQCYFRKG